MLVSEDDSAFGQRLAATDTFATLTAEFRDPFLDAAEARGELPPGWTVTTCTSGSVTFTHAYRKHTVVPSSRQ